MGNSKPLAILRAENVRSEKAVTEACERILAQKVPNDPAERTFADLIAEALIIRAIKGDIRAIKEITDRVEGPVVRLVAFEEPSRCPRRSTANIEVVGLPTAYQPQPAKTEGAEHKCRPC